MYHNKQEIRKEKKETSNIFLRKMKRISAINRENKREGRKVKKKERL